MIISPHQTTLDDDQCDEFRRLPCSFRDMVRAIYINGLINGITRYAYWQDGEQYVGSCRYKLTDVVAKLDQAIDDIVNNSWKDGVK